MIGFFLGFLYGSLLEYLIHDHLFHRMGKKKDSIFSYHLKGHHRLAKKNGFVDLTLSKVEFYAGNIKIGEIAQVFRGKSKWIKH